MTETSSVRFLRIVKKLDRVFFEGPKGQSLSRLLPDGNPCRNVMDATWVLYYEGVDDPRTWEGFLSVLREEGLDVDVFRSKLRERHKEVNKNNNILHRGAKILFDQSFVMDWIASQLQ